MLFWRASRFILTERAENIALLRHIPTKYCRDMFLHKLRDTSNTVPACFHLETQQFQ